MKAKTTKSIGRSRIKKKKKVKMPTAEKPPTFEGIYNRLQQADELKSGLNLSARETEVVLQRWLSIERAMCELPSWITAKNSSLPPDILEFISRITVQGSTVATVERNRKWVDLFSDRAWLYLQMLSGRLLFAPSGVEKEAADSIGRIINKLLVQLKNLGRMTAIQFQPGSKVANETYTKILLDCNRRHEARRKEAKRALGSKIRGSKKDQYGYFSLQCKQWARQIFEIHEAWLADQGGSVPTFITPAN